MAYDTEWKDRNLGGKIGVVASGVPGLVVREGLKIWNGDTERLDEINQQAAELENSPYNTATVTKENQDYYSKVMADYAKSKREAEFGFTPEQTAAAKQTFSETTNLGTQNAMNAGGNTLSKYINANVNANQNKFATGLAEADANLKMQKQQQVLNYLNQVGNAAGISQDVATQNFNKNILAEQAIGQAERDWYAQRDINRKGLIDAGVSIAGAAPEAISAAAPVAVAAASDERLKKNIVYLKTENGHKIYEFEYKNEPNVKYSGVMAQEVKKINPEAVIIGEDGYYKVLYNMIGVEMKKLN